MTAVIMIAVIAVGLPAAAWWLGGRRVWATHRARTDGDPWTDILRTHRLDPVEMRRVAAAVSWGNRLPDRRLRAAVTDWAQRDLRRIEAHRRHPSPLRRRSVMAGLTGALAVLAVLAWRFVAGSSGPGDVAVLCVLGVLVLVALVAEPVEQARLRGIIRRNVESRERAR